MFNRKEYDKAYYEQNREKIKEQKKAYYEQNREKIIERNKAYREQNREKIKEQKKAYREQNREEIKERNKAYREQNREKKKELNKAYREQNREKIKEQKKAYISRRKKRDPLFKFYKSVSSGIYKSIVGLGYTKKSRTYKILGIQFKEFQKYIKNQFTEDMNWQNHGSYWHLDHIVPVSLGRSEEEILQLNYYKNFRPLTGEENMQKSNKLILDIIEPSERERLKHIIDRNI